MRTPIVAAALGLSLLGCLTVGDTGTPGAGGGDEVGPGPGPGPTETPKVDVTVDKTAVATELKTANPLLVTVTGSGGFSGDVALTATVVDAGGAALSGWTVDLSAPSVTLTADGTATAMATVKVPPKSTGLVGMVKITGTSTATLGTPVATSTVTAANQITFSVKVDATTGLCVYPADAGNAASPVTIAQATKIRFFNTGMANLVIHADNNNGVPISHQGLKPNGLADPITEPNTAYEQTPIGAGPATWYCHAPDTNLNGANPKIVIQ